MIYSKFAQELINKGIEIHFEPLTEDLNPADHFDQELESYVHEINVQLEFGNLNYWFCASVWLSFKGLESEKEFLGGCSYSHFNDFTGADNDYFDDMLNTCLKDLKGKIEEIKTASINF